MKTAAAAAVLMFAVVFSGCADPAVSTAAVIVPSPEHPERGDVHLLFIPRFDDSRQQQAAVLYLPYRGISGLLHASFFEEGADEQQLRELLGITPDAVYRSTAPHGMQAVRLLARLEGFDGDLVFSYGRDAEVFWELLRRHAGDLADQQVLPYLRHIYDEKQISEAELARGLEALGGTVSPVRHIPLMYNDHGGPWGGELLRMTVRQILDALEGER